ncbi:MAG: DUF1295 domain-containing protein [Saprospiraceae bacterium]|nr:DUF1295 domain-containing protein [Saprospiraceae bacterium]
MMKYFKPLLPFVVGFLVLLFTESFMDLSLVNMAVQMTLFGLVVCWPIWKTEVLSYVDIGWPWGLVAIGVLTLFLGNGNPTRVWLIGGAYVFMGLRMGLGAIHLWRKGYLQKELPRYRYQRLRWERAGKSNTQLAMQSDAIMQGLANASYLAFPAFMIGANPKPDISFLEIIGIVLWVASFLFESLADFQKTKFLLQMKAEGQKNKVCNIGLWQYTRHPNYFAEWMVWNALVLAAIPSWLALQDLEPVVLWILLGLGLLFISRIMYTTLVYFTGAKPSEYYSLQKRPDYRAYTERVNMFFPGPPKEVN